MTARPYLKLPLSMLNGIGTMTVTIGFRFEHQHYFQRTAQATKALLDLASV